MVVGLGEDPTYSTVGLMHDLHTVRNPVPGYQRVPHASETLCLCVCAQEAGVPCPTPTIVSPSLTTGVPQINPLPTEQPAPSSQHLICHLSPHLLSSQSPASLSHPAP